MAKNEVLVITFFMVEIWKILTS